MTVNYKPRLSIEITPEQYEALGVIIPHGLRKPLFHLLIEGIIKLHEEGGYQALSALLTNYITIQQLTTIGTTRVKERGIKQIETVLADLRRV